MEWEGGSAYLESEECGVGGLAGWAWRAGGLTWGIGGLDLEDWRVGPGGAEGSLGE